MSEGLGYEFQPGRSQRRLLNSVNRGRLGPQANEALRILSMRLPQVLGGNPIAPEDLLRPRVGGSPSTALMESLRATGGAPTVPNPAPRLAGTTHAPFAVQRFDSAAPARVEGRPTITPGSSDPGLNPDGSRMGGSGTPTQGTLPGPGDPYVDRTHPTPGNRLTNTEPVWRTGPVDSGVSELLDILTRSWLRGPATREF